MLKNLRKFCETLEIWKFSRISWKFFQNFPRESPKSRPQVPRIPPNAPRVCSFYPTKYGLDPRSQTLFREIFRFFMGWGMLGFDMG